MSSLPSVEQCQQFLLWVNEIRAGENLPPIPVLDFDDAEPGMSRNCLSARNTGLRTLISYALTSTGEKIGLPEVTVNVTAAFDGCRGNDRWLAELRERMVEAGVVAP